MECDITDVGSSSQRHAKGLDRAIQVLIIHSVVIVPDAGRWIGYFVTHKTDAIVSRIRLDMIYYGARRGPGHDGRLHPHRGTNGRKREIGRTTANRELAIGDVVIHVAFAGMRLAPCVFVRANVRCFAEIGGTLIHRCVQVVGLDANPVRHAVMVMPGVVIRA